MPVLLAAGLDLGRQAEGNVVHQRIEAIEYGDDAVLFLERRNRNSQLGKVFPGQPFDLGSGYKLVLFCVEGLGLKVIRHKFRIHRVSECEAIIVNRNLILTKPGNGLANIFNGFTDSCNDDIPGLRKA